MEQKPRVSVVGEFTEEHARRVLMTSYRIWKRHLREQAEKEKITQQQS